MKKLLLLLFLSILSVNPISVFASTDEDGKMQSGYDERVKNERGRPVPLDSTTFFPTGFLDGTIIQEAPVQPIGAGRTHWDDRIDFNKFNCNTASGNALFNKKCFLRHSGVFTKIDISKDADLSGQTNYPSLNNVMVAEVDARYDENFSFGVAGFGVSSQGGIAQGGLQGGPGAEIWNSSHNAKQGAAIQVFAMDKDGNEITDGNGFPIGFPITVNGEDIIEKVGERNVVTSLNRKLFRGYCLKNGVEDYSMLASDPNCKVAWNMIFSLTPKMEVNKDLFRKPQSLSERDLGKTKISTYKIGVRIFPIVIGDDGKYYEPSYVADERMGKLAYADTSRYGITNIHNLVDVNGTKKGTVIEQSNYLAFATNSVVKDDGLYVPKFKFNQIMSAFKRLKDQGNNTGSHPMLSEFLNYYGNFITFQPRAKEGGYNHYAPTQEFTNNLPVSIVSLGCLIYDTNCDVQKRILTKQFQTDNIIMRAQMKKDQTDLAIMTVDMDNRHGGPATPARDTTFGFINAGSMGDIFKARLEEDKVKAEHMMMEAFENWKNKSVTSTYLIGGPGQPRDIQNSQIGKFLGTSAAVTAFNEANTNKSELLLDEGRTSLWHNLNGNEISFTNKNFDYQDGQPFSSAFRVNPEGNENVKDDKVNVGVYKHGQGAMQTVSTSNGKRKGYRTDGVGITSIPVSKLILNKAERDKYLSCEGEGENEVCKLKEDYTIYFYISKHNSDNAFAFAMSADMFKGPPNEPEKELVPIDLGLKMNQLCTFRKAVADTDPSQAYYKLLNADKSCKDIVVKHLFSATQDQGTDAFNQAWTIKEEPLENPTEPLQPGQRATMEVNHTNVCDLAFVGKVIASNTDILQRDIKDLKLRISSIPKNVEMLDAADINVGDKSVKFKSKPKGSDMNVENPILNTLGLLPGEDTKKVQGDFIIQACNGDIYRTPLNGDSDEQELYLKLEADSNAWAKSKGSKVCQYAFEYAFRPLAPQCSAIDTNTYGTDDSGEITVGKVKNGEPTTFKYPEDGSNRVVKDYEGFTSKSGEMAKYLTFTDMRIGNFGFCFELIKNTGNKL